MRARFILHGFAILVLLGSATVTYAEPYTPDDTLLAIELAALNSGVSAAWLRRVVRCETGGTFNPYAVGRLGEQGAAQLYPRGGEWPRFWAAGYGDPFNPYDAIHYMADAFKAGRARAWSCR